MQIQDCFKLSLEVQKLASGMMMTDNSSLKRGAAGIF
jgi:hypothetical protein